MKRVYISRNPGQSPHLERELTKNGFVVECKTQIEREAIHFPPEIPPSDWIFFSSPYAVDAFFQQNPEIGNARIAAIGSGTASALKSKVVIDFIGQDANTQNVAKDFKKRIGSDQVLFPSPEKGLRTVQESLLPQQVLELICYRTRIHPVQVEQADIYLFSSPSNVQGFAELNTFPKEGIYYAFGKSSDLALKENGVKTIESPLTYDEKVLVQAIFSKFAC